MHNVSCASLTEAQVEGSLRRLARCATSRDGPRSPAEPPPLLIDAPYCAAVAQSITAASDALVLAVGEGPGTNGSWDPTSTRERGGFPKTCGDFGARCRTRGNDDWRKGLVGVPFGEGGSTEASWVAGSICLVNGHDKRSGKALEKQLLGIWFD